jgi:hypothetical protein
MEGISELATISIKTNYFLMKIISEQEFANFLAKKPLYYKFLAVSQLENTDESNFTDPTDFTKKAFKINCPHEKEIQTFRTKLVHDNLIFARSAFKVENPHAPPVYFNEKTLKLDLIVHLEGICQSCGESITFSIRAYSDKSWIFRESGINIYIEKIGQYPPYEIVPDKNIEKYLLEEDLLNYRKALINLSVSYGIGAYAYFRRVIENEIKRLIDDISSIEFDGVDKVIEALKQYDKDHQMSNLIDVISKFLPASLKELGDNPIRLLYDQLSLGIHKFSDEECLRKAEMIDIILTYIITKINEEKYLTKNVRNAMRGLRSGC